MSKLETTSSRRIIGLTGTQVSTLKKYILCDGVAGFQQLVGDGYLINCNMYLRDYCKTTDYKTIISTFRNPIIVKSK